MIDPDVCESHEEHYERYGGKVSPKCWGLGTIYFSGFFVCRPCALESVKHNKDLLEFFTGWARCVGCHSWGLWTPLEDSLGKKKPTPLCGSCREGKG